MKTRSTHVSSYRATIGGGGNKRECVIKPWLLTFIVILGGDCEHRVLDVLVLVHLRLVQRLVEERWIVIFISDSDSNEFCN